MKVTFSPSNVSASSLRKAVTLAERIEAKRADLNALEAELQSLIGQPNGSNSTTRVVSRAKRQFTPEQKARISEGLRAKWAERKAASAAPSAPTPMPKVAQPKPQGPVATAAV